MSADASSIPAAPMSRATPGWSVSDIRVVRYALGATVAMGIALGAPWETSYLTPVLVATFLAFPGTPITPALGAKLVAVVGGAIYVGWQVGHLVAYPALFLILASLLLFWIFYAGQRGLPALVILWLVIAVTAIPFARMVYPAAAVLVARGLLLDVVLTAVIAVCAYGLLPEKSTGDAEPAAQGNGASVASPDDAFRTALIGIVVVVPVVALFYLYELSGALTVLAYVAILSSLPDIGTDIEAGKERIRGNLAGGLVAILVYNLVSLVPIFPFLLLLTLLACLALGSRAFRNGTPDSFFVTACSTTLLIVGGTAFQGEASSEVYLRVLQITIAVTYVVLGFEFMNRRIPRPR
jgi:hypothetical protein